MALPSLLQSLEGVHEAIAAEYTQTDHGFLLQVTPTEGQGEDGSKYNYALENVSGLKSSLSRQSEEAKTAKSRVAELQGQYEETKALLEAAGEIKSKDTKAQIDAKVKEAIKANEEKWGADVTAANTDRDKWKALRTNDKLELAIETTINKYGGNDYLRDHLKNRTVAETADDGAVSILIKGDDGSTLYGNDGNPMTLSNYTEQRKKQPQHAGGFNPNPNVGGGKTGDAQTATTAQSNGRMSPEEASKLASSDPKAFAQARADGKI